MPKEGRNSAVAERTMPRRESSRTETRRRKSATPVDKGSAAHRAADLLGLALLAVALIVLTGLAMGQAGFVGEGLTGFFKLVFGHGAWGVPIIAGFGGIILMAGRTDHAVPRVMWGTAIILAGLLGLLAQPAGGDYFVDTAMSGSGGAIGAVVAWAFGSLFGFAKPAVLVILMLGGVVLAIDTPLREILERMARPLRRDPDAPRVLTARAKSEESVAETDRATQRRQAAVAMAERGSVMEVGPEDVDILPTNAKPEKPAPRITEMNRRSSEEIRLDTVTREPVDGYELPPLSLLAEGTAGKKRDAKEVERNIATLENTLEQFNIEANVVEVATGPTITRFEVQLGPGIRVNRITALADNIAMSLAASHVRVEAPIPGKSAIGVEVPNSTRTMVTLREMVDTLEFHDVQSKLLVALGKDVSGVNKYADLTRMPHMLVGGATNSGKSICLATLIMSLILKMTPKDLRLVMIDPKRVELTLFEGLPHLMCPVVKDVKEAAGVLRAVVREMDRRYDRFSEAQVRNIDGWNAKATFNDRMPYIVVIVDELADLMIQCGAEVETSICRLAQLARATGIHLVIATQRPSVDVITGTIKNNIPSRIAFAVSSGIDSRTVLDQSGAEDLIGRGDMLFLPIDASKPVRIQGCYVTEKEIEEVCTFWRNQEKPQYVISPIEYVVGQKESELRGEDSDALWEDVVRFVVERGEASTSMIQRKFSIGFQRASRLLDAMEERGIVGKRDGPRPREVLMDVMQVEALFGRGEYMTPMDPSEVIED